jgi:predicted flavoprotein YhiN
MNISGTTSSSSLFSPTRENKDGQELPVNSSTKGGNDTSALIQSAEDAKAAAKAKNEKAIADFNAYMGQSTMEKYVESWLQRHGVSKEQFESMSPEEKLKITNQIKEDFVREAKLTIEKKQKTLNIFA